MRILSIPPKWPELNNPSIMHACPSPQKELGVSANVGHNTPMTDPTPMPPLQYVQPTGDMSFAPAEQKILDHINQKIAASPHIDETIDFLFDQTHNICPCDRISVAFVTDDARRVTSYYTRTDYDNVILQRGYSEDLRGSSLERIIQTGQPRLINDLEAYAREHPTSRSSHLLLKEGVRSSMTVPLSVDRRNIGLLFRSSREPHAYNVHHVRLHLAIAERLSQTIEKAWRIEQLEAANTAYMEMLSFVTHELKSPIASMVMTAESLLDGHYGTLEDDQAQRIERMVFKGQYLLTLIRDYLNLARLETGKLECSPTMGVDFIERVIEPAIEMIQPWLEGKDMTLEKQFSGEGSVDCDPDLMTIAMTNLIGNAAKYGRKGGTIRLSVNRGPARVDVSVWNEGQGFKDEDRRKLFHKFSRLDDPELRKAKGTGVGLYTVWRIVNQHGGRIEAHSRYGQWAEFNFWIPQPLQCYLQPPPD